MTIQFSPPELQTLRLFCDTLIPSLSNGDDPHGYYARRASDLQVHERIAEALVDIAEPEMVQQMRLFLRFLEQPWFNRILGGKARSFSAMSLEERTALLQAWRTSKLNLRRKTFQSLKRLAMFIYYGIPDGNGVNPNWVSLNYPAPPLLNGRPTESISKIKPFVISESTTLTADVVIIGSGAGGGVMAGELTAAGLDVLVLEKGGYYAEADFDGTEYTSTQKMYENKGLVVTKDLGMAIIAGSTLGGGTTINWSASFRTPDDVLQEWERDYGVTGLTGNEYQQAMDAVSAQMCVNTTESIANAQNQVLETGAKALNLSWGVIPRNGEGCDDCGFCNYGCMLGAKRSTLRTYLTEAYQRGARILVQTHADKIIIEAGQATGVLAKVTDAQGQVHDVTIKAKVVVVSAGSLHTPALLLRSGLKNDQIGRNLHLHPTTFTYGLYDEPVRGWSGKIMTRYVDSWRNLDGKGYGVMLETAPTHPSLSSLVLPWESPFFHKQTMSILEKLSGIIVLTRDFYGGRVTINKRGKPLYEYKLHPHDAGHMMRGMVESLRIHAAAGAQIVGTSFEGIDQLEVERGDLDAYVEKIAAQKLVKNTYALLSAHQMGSCRMAGSPAMGALQPTGETWEIKGLYVADGSVFPTASGVNPMLTIMSLAHVIAQYVKAEYT